MVPLSYRKAIKCSIRAIIIPDLALSPCPRRYTFSRTSKDIVKIEPDNTLNKVVDVVSVNRVVENEAGCYVQIVAMVDAILEVRFKVHREITEVTSVPSANVFAYAAVVDVVATIISYDFIEIEWYVHLGLEGGDEC
jgi:hypothetical protein